MTTTTTSEAHAKICPECGRTFHTNRPAKVFCDETCRVAYANLSLSRGKPVTPLLVTWRRHRNSEIGKAALRELCRIASMYIEEDRKDGRECALQVEALLTGFHVKKFDRPARARKMSKATAAARPENRATA
jgi:hypothetical protein